MPAVATAAAPIKPRLTALPTLEDLVRALDAFAGLRAGFFAAFGFALACFFCFLRVGITFLLKIPLAPG
jgi:hypothetical protein